MQNIKLAIHKRKGSFSDRWITYCQEHNIPYKIVNCYESDIINKVKDCDGLLWNWAHSDYRAHNFAQQLIYTLEKMGKNVFPSFDTCWHYDDKVGQKYLFEAKGIPAVPTYVFYDKKEAIKWANHTEYPKVFKLRGGAGGSNVKLIKNRVQAKRLISKAFTSGFAYSSKIKGMKQRLWVLRRDKDIKSVFHFLKGIVRLFFSKKGLDLLPRQKGYVYFQDFVKNNDFDDRIVVIGEKAIAIRRYNRQSDFRASGSGLIDHNPAIFDIETIRIAFNVSKLLNSQSTAFDFVYGQNKDPLVLEVSYTFSMGLAYDSCPGYWDKNLVWHEDNVNPQRHMIEDFINEITSQKQI